MTVLFQQLTLRNRFMGVSLPVGYKQFRRLVENFQRECDHNMWDGCAISLKLMTEAPFHQARVEADPRDEAANRAMENAENERKTIARLDSLDGLSQELFTSARHIEVTAMTKTRANSDPDYREEYAGGKLILCENRKQVDISLQGMMGEIKLSL